MGPRGLGPIKQSCFQKHFSSGVQVSKPYFWDFGHVKTSLLALAGFQTTFLDFGHLKVQKVNCFDYVRIKAMLVLVFYLFQNMLLLTKYGRVSPDRFPNDILGFLGEK